MPTDLLKTRALRGQIRAIWFQNPAIGIFKDIVATLDIPPEEVLRHIKNAGKKNAISRTYLKTRHLELTRILYSEGISFPKIATCLSDLEGFVIDPKHLRDLSGANNQNVPEEKDPRFYQNRKKKVRSVGNNLELFIRDNNGEEQVFANVVVNPSNDREKHLQCVPNDTIRLLIPHTRTKIIQQLIQKDFSPKQIADILSIYQGFPILETEVTNEANKGQITIPPSQGRRKRYPAVKIQSEKDKVVLIRKNDVIEIRNDLVLQCDSQLIKVKDMQIKPSNSADNKKGDPENAIIQEWNATPDIGIGRDLCQKYGVKPERLRQILAHQHHKGILKSGHNHLLKELRQIGVPNREIASVFTQLEGFNFAENTIRAEALQLRTEGEISNLRGNMNLGGSIDGDLIVIVDRTTTPLQVIKKISIKKVAENIVQNGQKLRIDMEEDTPKVKSDWNLRFKTYIFYEWHAVPTLGCINEVARRINISPAIVREILNTRGGSYPKIKTIHLHLIKELYEEGIGHWKIARLLSSIEGIKFSNEAIKFTIKKGINNNLIKKPVSNKILCLEFEKEEIFIRDKRDGKIIREINLSDLNNNVLKKGLGRQFLGFYDNLPPTPEQVEQICTEVNSKQTHTIKEIAIKIGIRSPLVKTIILYKVFAGDEVEFIKQFGPTLPSSKIDKIVTLTRYTNYSLNQIAELCDCTRTAVKKYAILNAYFGNKVMFEERFHLVKIPLNKREEIVRCNQDRKKFPTIASIAFQTDLPSATVYRILLKDFYGGDRDALSKDYPGAKIITGNQKALIITLMRDTNKSLSEIASASGVSVDAVIRIALSEVFPENVEQYHKRFPISQLDDNTREKALLLIGETGSNALSQTQIVDKLNAEGYPITPDMVSKLSKQVYPDPSIRVKRFPGDVQKKVGEFTHLLCKGLFKQELRSKNIVWCSEVILQSPSPRWQKVIADGIVMLQPRQFEEIFNQVGSLGLPLWEELGLDISTIKNLHEILIEFTTRKSKKAIQIKADKYAKNNLQRPIQGRLVFIVNTDEWFSYERVLPGLSDAPNTRVVSMTFATDLFNLSMKARKILEQAIFNSHYWHLENQAQLVRNCGFQYESDTEEYLKIKEQQEKDFSAKYTNDNSVVCENDKDEPQPGSQQTLNNYFNTKNNESSTNSKINNSPQNSEDGESKLKNSSAINSKEIKYDSRAICAALFPDRRRQLLLQQIEEELAWEEYQRQLAATKESSGHPFWNKIPYGVFINQEIPREKVSHNKNLLPKKNIDIRPDTLSRVPMYDQKRSHSELTSETEVSKHTAPTIQDSQEGNQEPVPVPEDASTEYPHQQKETTSDLTYNSGDNGENSMTDPEDTKSEDGACDDPEPCGDEDKETIETDTNEPAPVKTDSILENEMQDIAEEDGEPISNTLSEAKKGEIEDSSPKETPSLTPNNPAPAEEAPQSVLKPAIEVTSDGGFLLLEGGNPEKPTSLNDNEDKPRGYTPDHNDGKGKPLPSDTNQLEGGKSNPAPQRGDDTATSITEGKSIEVTGGDMQSIRNAAAYGDGALVMGKDGKAVLLSPNDTKNIKDVLDHVKKSANNAREDVCTPDPSTKIATDGRDITGEGRKGIPITGKDLNAICDAGKRGDPVSIITDKGSLHLDGNDTRKIKEELNFVQKFFANAREDVCTPDPTTKIAPDGRDINGEGKKGLPITNNDLDTIRAAGRRGDPVTIITDRGSLHLDREETRQIWEACGRVQKTLDNACKDMFRPDPETNAQPDSRDITGEGKKGIPISGKDLGAIGDAGKRGEPVSIITDKGSLHLDEKDTCQIREAVDHAKNEIAAANPSDASQGEDAPVINGADLKNTNPKEDPYAVHTPQEVRGKVEVTPADLRDIRAGGSGEVGGPVVISTDAGRKVISRETAAGINSALDQVGMKLSKKESNPATREQGDHPPTNGRDDHPTHERSQEHTREYSLGDSPRSAPTPDRNHRSAPPVPSDAPKTTRHGASDLAHITDVPSRVNPYANDNDPNPPHPDKYGERQPPAARDRGKEVTKATEGDLSGLIARDGPLHADGEKITLEPFEWKTDPPRVPREGGTDSPAPEQSPDKPAPGDSVYQEEPKEVQTDPVNPDSGPEESSNEDQPPEDPENGEGSDPFWEDSDDEWVGWNPESGQDAGEEGSEGENDRDQKTPEEDEDGEAKSDGWDADEGHDQGEDHSEKCPDRGERGSFL